MPLNPYNSKGAWPAWLVLSAFFIALDQSTKSYFSGILPLGSRHAVNDIFNLVHTRNYGAAFSFLADAGGWQRYFFLAFALAVSAVLATLIVRGVKSRLETFAYSAIIGGAMGNAFDRIRLGYVVDFLDFHWKDWHWPAFNVADICLSLGVLFLLMSSLVQSARSHSS